MALIKCSECGKEISDKAVKCVHCGYAINLTNDKNTNTENCNSNIVGQKKIKKVLIISTLVVPIIISLICNSLVDFISWAMGGIVVNPGSVKEFLLIQQKSRILIVNFILIFITMCIYNLFLYKKILKVKR